MNHNAGEMKGKHGNDVWVFLRHHGVFSVYFLLNDSLNQQSSHDSGGFCSNASISADSWDLRSKQLKKFAKIRHPGDLFYLFCFVVFFFIFWKKKVRQQNFPRSFFGRHVVGVAGVLPRPLLEKGMNFGIRVAFDSGKCTGPDCDMDWHDYGVWVAEVLQFFWFLEVCIW